MRKRSEIWKDVMEAVTSLTEVTQAEIFSPSKKADITQARGLLFWTLTKKGLRPATIMRLCKTNGWETIVHSTITKHIKRSTVKVKKDDEFKLFLREIESCLASVAKG